jgi:hypothetical protein
MLRTKIKLLLLMAVCLPVLAENWILDTDIPLANAQTAGVVGYVSEPTCVAANPGHTCFEFSEQNLRYRKIVGGVWVDDATLKAVYDAEQAALSGTFDIGVAFARASGGGGLDCTASPCSIDRNFPSPEKIESVTRLDVGVYRANFVSGSWLVAPLCAAANDLGGGLFCAINGLPTTSEANLLCFTGAGALVDTQPIIICGGK